MIDTHSKSKSLPTRRPVTLSVRRDLLAEAKALKLNASRAAENGLVEAIRKANEQAWLAENKQSIEAYNKFVQKNGIFYTPDWLKEDGAI